jgi:hypothetical protein
MPPRKRAASAPNDEPEQEPLAPEADASTEPDDDTEVSAPAADATDEVPADTDDADQDDEAARSDLQTVGQPCQECFPNGWPEGAFSVGCTHGTYVRTQH